MNHSLPTRRRLWMLLLLVASLFLLDVLAYLVAEGLWFRELGYLSVFWKRFQTQGFLGATVFTISLAMVWGNQSIAHRYLRDAPREQSALQGGMRFRLLMPLTLGMALMIFAVLLHHGAIAIDYWHSPLNLDNPVEQLPVKLSWQTFWKLGQQASSQPWQWIVLLAGAIVLLVFPRLVLPVIGLLVSLGFALVVSEHWATVLLAQQPTRFDQADPLFGINLEFYIFQLPLWELLVYWLLGLTTLALLGTALIYLLANNSLSNGKFPGFTHTQVRHLYGLGSSFMGTVALSYWLDRVMLLYSRQGVSFGASYTDVYARLPAYTLLSLLALVICLLLLGRAVIPLFRPQLPPPPIAYPPSLTAREATPPAPVKDLAHNRLAWMLLGYLALIPLLTVAVPTAMQLFIVQPTELELETPFLDRTIALTRRGFALENIQVDNFTPQGNLTQADLQNNSATVTNIRLWATEPLLETNRQLERIRPYYEFPGADVDRYLLPSDDNTLAQRQILIAARELDYNSVPADAQTWQNRHLIYTHGYGFTMSPVNTAAEGGLPDYFIRGIGQTVSDPRIRNTIPIGSPRIYYGEITTNHVITQTRVRELDFPSGSDNVYNSYDGWGGIGIGNWAARLLFARHLLDWRMVLSEDLTPQSRLLFRRQIQERVEAIAPFLRYDRNPYLVVVDIGNQPLVSNFYSAAPAGTTPSPSHLYWMIDAYTTSDRYPYSDPGENDFNYIRNSVKVVVDAYNGHVAFYVADPEDPIIQSWSRIFPDLFHPFAHMPLALQRHIRYPEDFYSVQSNQLMVYHMTEPQVFYNREDQWRAPNEVYGGKTQPVRPYYLIMKLPAGSVEEFLLFLPFTPNQRTNLIAWMSARSDGENYGKVLLYRFPKQELVFGPEQLEARINQDPVISQQISLWNRRGSQVIQGNLLVIPIEESLLYVEPLYLVAEQNQLPTLARVIVAYGNRIIMAETLERALEGIFQPQTLESTPIIRPVDEEDAAAANGIG
ncbi:MAG TPA: UPF0182 family protein [Synechococcales cyanobacterium M55_K2018_004]|nr:UPF0182 family protein [Synechococcales cyanobacterium M55_K2018_004]